MGKDERIKQEGMAMISLPDRQRRDSPHGNGNVHSNDNSRMPKREEQPTRHGQTAKTDHLARCIVNCRDVVGVKAVPEA